MKNFINRALVAKKKLKLFFAFREARPPCEPGSEERGVCLTPKNRHSSVVKMAPFHADFRPFSPLFFSIFQPIFGCSQNSVRASLTTRLALACSW